MSEISDRRWPRLQYAEWRDTALTLQLWTQIVGKVRLALTPWLNHSWHVPLYVTARGLGSSPIPIDGDLLEMDFDFINHRVICRTSRGDERSHPLRPQTVAEFYDRLLGTLADFGVMIVIKPIPSEVANPIPFPADHVHAAYDAKAVYRFWRALISADRLFKLFRSGFIGKASPVHFFWGSFDLAVTRFSGRVAKPHPGGVPGLPDMVVREAYSHEVSSAGFWPGSDAYPEAAFYSYAYPEPPGFRSVQVSGPARFNADLGEFILPYDEVRQASDPDALVLRFLSQTYAAAADCGEWDRDGLECPLGLAGRPRAVPTEDPD
jgi:hypothetical protein